LDTVSVIGLGGMEILLLMPEIPL